MTDDTDFKLVLILRQEKTLLEQMRVIQVTMANKVGIVDLRADQRALRRLRRHGPQRHDRAGAHPRP